MASDSKMKRISRLLQWRIERIDTIQGNQFRREVFKFGRWDWCLVIGADKKNDWLAIGIRCMAKEQLPDPFATAALSVFDAFSLVPFNSRVQGKQNIKANRPCCWCLGTKSSGPLIIEIEFLDLKISPSVGGEACPLWPGEGTIVLQYLATGNTHQWLTRMLEEETHADLTINTADGTLRAHKAVLCSRSPVFKSMFHHNFKEGESSTINMDDMSVESCTAFVRSIYGVITTEEFWKHRMSLLEAAHKYDIADLRDCCEGTLLEDIHSSNVLERLQTASLYQLPRLKKECFMYLFDFRKIRGIREEMDSFFAYADRQLLLEMFGEALAVQMPL